MAESYHRARFDDRHSASPSYSLPPEEPNILKRGCAKSKLKTCNYLILFANVARIPSRIRGFASRHPLHAGASSRLHALLDKFFEDEERGLIAALIISEILRQVGFSRWYDTVEELLQVIVDACSN